MRIVDRKTFLAMPAGTIFAKYTPHVFGDIGIKEETVGNDFVVQDLTPWWEGCERDMDYFDVMEAMVRGEPSPPPDYDFAGRDGLFDQEQLFAVWEPRDAEALIARLQQALASSRAAAAGRKEALLLTGKVPTMILPADFSSRLGAALAKAYGRVPVSWALSLDDFYAVRRAQGSASNSLQSVSTITPAGDLQLFGLPAAPAGDGPSVLIVHPLDSEKRQEIPV